MSATGQITEEALCHRIAELEEQLSEAERVIGAATVDGKSTAAATKQAGGARESIRRAEVALEELERRRDQAEEEAARGQASRARAGTYESLDEYLEHIEAYTTRRDAFMAAEEALLRCRLDRRVAATKAGWGYSEQC